MVKLKTPSNIQEASGEKLTLPYCMMTKTINIDTIQYYYLYCNGETQNS